MMNSSTQKFRAAVENARDTTCLSGYQSYELLDQSESESFSLSKRLSRVLAESEQQQQQQTCALQPAVNLTNLYR